ncbi:MAG: hypothetical protein ABI162_08705 [Luteolibacter sp.]
MKNTRAHKAQSRQQWREIPSILPVHGEIHSGIFCKPKIPVSPHPKALAASQQSPLRLPTEEKSQFPRRRQRGKSNIRSRPSMRISRFSCSHLHNADNSFRQSLTESPEKASNEHSNDQPPRPVNHLQAWGAKMGLVLEKETDTPGGLRFRIASNFWSDQAVLGKMLKGPFG